MIVRDVVVEPESRRDLRDQQISNRIVEISNASAQLSHLRFGQGLIVQTMRAEFLAGRSGLGRRDSAVP